MYAWRSSFYRGRKETQVAHLPQPRSPSYCIAELSSRHLPQCAISPHWEQNPTQRDKVLRTWQELWHLKHIRENRELPLFIMSRLCHGDRLSNWLICIFPFQYMILLISMQFSSSWLGRDLGPLWTLFSCWCPVGVWNGYYVMWMVPAKDSFPLNCTETRWLPLLIQGPRFLLLFQSSLVSDQFLSWCIRLGSFYRMAWTVCLYPTPVLQAF